MVVTQGVLLSLLGLAGIVQGPRLTWQALASGQQDYARSSEEKLRRMPPRDHRILPLDGMTWGSHLEADRQRSRPQVAAVDAIDDHD